MSTHPTETYASSPQANTISLPRSPDIDSGVGTSTTTSLASSPTTTKPEMHPHVHTDRALIDAFKSALTAANIESAAELSTVIPAFHMALREQLKCRATDAVLLHTYGELARNARDTTDELDAEHSPRSRGCRAVDRDLAQMLQKGMVLREGTGTIHVPKAVARFVERGARVPAGVQVRSEARARRLRLYRKRQAETLRKALEERLGYREEGASEGQIGPRMDSTG